MSGNRVSFGTGSTRSGQTYGPVVGQTGSTYGSDYNRYPDYEKYSRTTPGSGQGYQVYGNTLYNAHKGKFGLGGKRKTYKKRKGTSKKKRQSKRQTKRSYK